jgi:hypothetical protein
MCGQFSRRENDQPYGVQEWHGKSFVIYSCDASRKAIKNTLNENGHYHHIHFVGT